MSIIRNFKRKAPAEIVLHCIVSLIFMAVALSYLYILFWIIMAGFKSHTEIVMNPFSLPTTWHWENYLDVMDIFEVNGHGFWEMLFNSLYFSIIGKLLPLLTCVSFTYVCTKYKFPGSELPYAIILITMTLPVFGVGGASYKLYHSLGLVDSYAQVLAAMGGITGQFLYFRAYFLNMSWTYAEAAQIDGADHFQTFFRVMLPQTKPLFTALFVSDWMVAWNDFSSALVYLPNLPTLPVGIYQFNTEMVYRARLDILFAACFWITLPALILYIIFNKTITTNVSLGGIKG